MWFQTKDVLSVRLNLSITSPHQMYTYVLHGTHGLSGSMDSILRLWIPYVSMDVADPWVPCNIRN